MTTGRLMLRADGYWARSRGGVAVLTPAGQNFLTGASIGDWINRLAPLLDGGRTLDQLTGALPAQQAAFIAKLVTSLLECGLVEDLDDDFGPGVESAVLVGGGPLLPAVARALRKAGCVVSTEHRATTELAVQVPGREYRAIVTGGEVWFGTGPGWRRIKTGDTTRGGASSSALRVAANQLAHEVLRHQTGFTRIALNTLHSSTHQVLPHPYEQPARPESGVEFRDRVDRLERGAPLTAEEFSRRVARLSDSRAGVFDDLDEGDFAQLPLHISRTAVAGEVVFGSGADFATARYRAALTALAVYGSRMADPRRMLDRSGRALAPPDSIVDGGSTALGHGYVRAMDLATGETVLREAGQVFSSAVPGACAAAYSWPDAVRAGLIAQCRWLTIAEIATRLDVCERLILAGDARSLSLEALGLQVTAYDVTGTLGVPVVACQLEGRTVAYECAPTEAEALRQGLEQTLLAYQAQANGEPDYAPPAVPALPEPLRGDRVRPTRPNTPLTVPGLVAALNRCGHVVAATPLDHDRHLHLVMPYLVAVVVTDAHG